MNSGDPGGAPHTQVYTSPRRSVTRGRPTGAAGTGQPVLARPAYCISSDPSYAGRFTRRWSATS
jgi:hypothetical protein